MAFANYSSSNENWAVPAVNVSSNQDLLIANHSNVTMSVSMDHSDTGVSTFSINIQPGAFYSYRPGTAGTVTCTGVSTHGTVAAGSSYHNSTEHNEAQGTLTSGSRLFVNTY